MIATVLLSLLLIVMAVGGFCLWSKSGTHDDDIQWLKDANGERHREQAWLKDKAGVLELACDDALGTAKVAVAEVRGLKVSFENQIEYLRKTVEEKGAEAASD